ERQDVVVGADRQGFGLTLCQVQPARAAQVDGGEAGDLAWLGDNDARALVGGRMVCLPPPVSADCERDNDADDACEDKAAHGAPPPALGGSGGGKVCRQSPPSSSPAGITKSGESLSPFCRPSRSSCN